MKKSIQLSFILLTGLILSCNQNQTSSAGAEDSKLIPEHEDALERQCFEAVSGRDTAILKLNNLDGKITGKLSFNFYEKDDSDGDISGEFKGDTLFVDYIFKSEGTISRNPQAFLKKDGKLYQGSGNIETYLGKTYFKNNADISFGDGFVFESKTCE